MRDQFFEDARASIQTRQHLKPPQDRHRTIDPDNTEGDTAVLTTVSMSFPNPPAIGASLVKGAPPKQAQFQTMNSPLEKF